MKPFFLRLRPSRDPALEGLVHIVNGYKGGKFGFASSHAANTFAVAVFVWHLLKVHFRYVGVLFFWAAFVAYSRIYLGVHYPGDVIVGVVIGSLIGWIMFLLQSKLLKKKITDHQSNT
jgi:undecaprenyl-diphosphatase